MLKKVKKYDIIKIRRVVLTVNLTRCQNGHFYDADKFSYCPHCPSVSDSSYSLRDAVDAVRNSSEIPSYNSEISLVRCNNGHFYDENKYLSCPHCNEFFDVPDDIENTDDLFTTVLVEEPSVSTTVALSNEYGHRMSQNNNKRIFISYSHEDSDSLRELRSILDRNNYNYWYDEGIPSGEEFADTIVRNIKAAEQFVVLISRNSVRSKYVKDEVHIAYKNDKQILVIYIDDVVLEDGLELFLDRNQAIHRELINEYDYERKICEFVSPNALGYVKDRGEAGAAKQSFKTEYKIIKPLGTGGFGQSFLVENNRTGVRAIAKRFISDRTMSRTVLRESLEREKVALKKIKCPYTPTLIDYFDDESEAYIIETYFSGHDLTVVKESDNMTYEKILNIGMQLLKIEKYLAHYKFVHCDIKPENIIINRFGEVFLIDFGAALEVKSDNSSTKFGTIGFAPPELRQSHSNINFATDLYQIGKLIQILLVNYYKNYGFNKNYDVEINFNIRLQDCNPFINVELLRVLNKLMSDNYYDRYSSIDEAIEDFSKILRLPY